MLDKEKIKKHFSRAATSYDEYAHLQRRIGEKLISMLDGKMLEGKIQDYKILDIGTGTGDMAIKLSHKYKLAKIYACDVAPGMIEVASLKSEQLPNIFYSVCDGEKLHFDNASMDLVISNVAFQWMDVMTAFKEVSRVLKSKSKFIFSSLGPKTLCELKEIDNTSVHEFIAPKLLKKLLVKLGFREIKINSQVVVEKYPDAISLFYSLKNIGAQSVAQAQVSLGGREKFKNLIEVYERKFKRKDYIIATFEALYGSALNR